MQSAVHHGVAVHQELAPVRKKLRVVVLALGMSLQASVDEHAHGRCGKRAGLRFLLPAALPAPPSGGLLHPGCRRCLRRGLFGDHRRARQYGGGGKQ